MDEKLAAAVLLGDVLNLVTILVEPAKVAPALPLLLAPTDLATSAEATAEHECPEPDQADQGEEARLQ